MGARILQVPGKRGLNAFSSTRLDEVLKDRGITEVILAGVVTSICIDSTGRAAHERGYGVTVLSDCTAGRTRFEQDFYCREVFPLYARVRTSDEVAAELISGSLVPETAPA
jgi:nicotinamidase-related amidase